MCESLVRDLIGGKKSGNTSEQLKAQHETNLEDFQDTPDLRAYYQALYKEVFEPKARATENIHIPAKTEKKDLTPEEKLKEAFNFMVGAIERG